MSIHPFSSPLVPTEWLAAHLDDPEVRIVDVRWRSRYEDGRGISADDHEGYWPDTSQEPCSSAC